MTNWQTRATKLCALSRIRMLERLVLYMRQNGAWIAGCEEVARYVLAQNGKEADADAVAK